MIELPDGRNTNPIETAGELESLWYETPAEIEAGLAWGERKAYLMRWVRREMKRKLSSTELFCFQMYFFKGMSFREIAKITKTNRTSVQDAIQRSVLRLRACARRSKTMGIGRAK